MRVAARARKWIGQKLESGSFLDRAIDKCLFGVTGSYLFALLAVFVCQMGVPLKIAMATGSIIGLITGIVIEPKLKLRKRL